LRFTPAPGRGTINHIREGSLFLKTLEMHGFKTFARKTTLQFRPGVTAIVGPNGCGKSNVVDAIRWVLGESSARSLRGEIMEDVIFSGSEEVKPLGMAEVGITLVNDDNLLPIEYSEVSIKRRLYRSGESEFFINNNSVRLRDIHELFADTGIGKPSYSIMEQGNIDQILSNKPDDRMLIFEEAAGITRYKSKIKDSYRKLSATDENLARLNLVVSEVEKEFQHLEEQSRKAHAYRELKQEELRSETLYNRLRVNDLNAQIEKNASRLKELTGQKKEKEEALNQLNESVRLQLERMRGIESENVEIKNSIYKKDAELEAIRSKKTHIHERLQEIESEIEKRKKMILEHESKREKLKQRIDQVKGEQGRLNELLESQQEKADSFQKEVEHLQQLVRESTAKIEANRRTLTENEKKVSGLRASLREIVDKLVQEIDGIRDKFSGQENRKNLLVRQVNENLARIESTLKHHLTKLRDLSFAPPQAESSGRLVEELIQETAALVKKTGSLSADIETVLGLQNELNTLMFGEESLHTRKTRVEEQIDGLLKESEKLKEDNLHLEEEITRNRERAGDFEEMIRSVQIDLTRNRERLKHVSENLERMLAELDRSEEDLQDMEVEIRVHGERKTRFEQELEQLSGRSTTIAAEKSELERQIESNNQNSGHLFDEVRGREQDLEKDRDEIENLSRLIEETEIRNAELGARVSAIQENFRDRYGKALELVEVDEDANIDEVNRSRSRIKSELGRLGHVNLMAIEEFEEVKKRFQYLTEQREDLEKAKADLHQIVDQTLNTSRDLFMTSFKQIKQNFQSIFHRLFNGGQTDLFLTNENDIFDTGVEIMACPPGKSLKRRTLLSGGEKSLTAVALLFSIFMVRPSPFCLLDEVDHDLDEENVIRFLKLLKEFTDTTQFVVITHNRRTIEFADVIYGITSEQAGVSKAVSLEMVNHAVR
jgi:chromosome segregation protein